jgi:large subunit ribosomal protein L23
MVQNVNSLSVIKRPVITEKSTFLSANNQVVFMVDSGATKPEIKSAVEDIFAVKVKAVNVVNNKGKQRVFRGYRGKRSGFKKAIITLEAGQTIDITAGVK